MAYRATLPPRQPSDPELAEIVRRVHEDGYVLLWSTVLKDLVAFYKTESDLKKIPPLYIPYSEQELRALFGDAKTAPSPNGFYLIHEAKKHGGRIIGSEPRLGEGGK